MKNGARNVRIIAVNAAGKHGFDIFLDFSGQREYLMSHRHNGPLYSMLCDGAPLDEVRRWRPAAGRREQKTFRDAAQFRPPPAPGCRRLPARAGGLLRRRHA